ncbi:MAG: hypothetical protein AAFQ12_11190, partial [Pseudomonadota bacterium]
VVGGNGFEQVMVFIWVNIHQKISFALRADVDNLFDGARGDLTINSQGLLKGRISHERSVLLEYAVLHHVTAR